LTSQRIEDVTNSSREQRSTGTGGGEKKAK
jgi:hypothetical protein